MGLFFADHKNKKVTKKAKKQDLSKIPQNLLRDQGCKVCSLNGGNGAVIPAGGDSDPLVYVLGEMPGPRETQTGIHFRGDSGTTFRKALREAAPDLFTSKRDLTQTESVRFNYCVQCPTDKHRQPKESEIECCHKSIEKDIEKTKPFAIIGLGPIALKWVIGYNNIDEWRGRRIPIKVGSHTCWYFPVQTPALLKKKKNTKFKNEYEKAFDLDLQKAADFILDEDSPEAKVYIKDFDKGVTIYDGSKTSQLKQIEEFLEKMKFVDSTSIDTETDRLKPFGVKDAKIITISIGTFDKTLAFPIDHPKGWKTEKDRKKVKELVNDFMMTARGVKAPHNLKFEAIWFNYYYGQRPIRSGEWGDTMAQAYTIDNRTKKERNKGMLGVGVLTLLHFGFNLKKLTDIKIKDLLSEPLDKVLRYNAMDTKWTHKLYVAQDAILEDSQRWTYEHLCRTGISFAITESMGVPVDLDVVEDFRVDFEKKLIKINKSIAKLKSIKKFGKKYGEFNPGSPDHVVLLFKEVLQLRSVKGTKEDKDGFSTDNEVLKKFSEKGHAEADLILQFREIAKLKSTYIDPVQPEGKASKILFPDGMFHADYNHLFTSTGRSSSENPNMQNYPKRKNKEIRRMVVPPPGCLVMPVDYGQLEARIIAMASKDKAFCEAVRNNYDIHTDWAKRIIKLHPPCAGVNRESEVDAKMLKEFRGRTKNEWVFPLFFGASTFMVSASLGLPMEKAERLVKEFWKEFPGVKKWQAKLQKFYDEHGYVETLTGARRQGPLSYNEMINAPIQGTGSYVVNDGMNRLSLHAYETNQLQFQARMNIHDDLTFFLPEESLEDDLLVIAEMMCCSDFKFMIVPLAVEVEGGENWADTEKIMEMDTTDFED